MYAVLNPFYLRNLAVTSGPNAIEAPLLLGVLPGEGAGSAHKRSQNAPLTGGSKNLSIALIYLSPTPSSEGRPPWHTIILLFKTYDRGRAQNISEMAS